MPIDTNIVVDAFAVYATIGIGTAVGFLAFGLPRVVPQATATMGARIVLFPGIAALWPLVLSRCLQARDRR